jgi:hypothetical protein
VPAVLACPGFLSWVPAVRGDGDEREYLSYYEIDSAAAMDSAEFNAVKGWDRFAPHVDVRMGLVYDVVSVARPRPRAQAALISPTSPRRQRAPGR